MRRRDLLTAAIPLLAGCSALDTLGQAATDAPSTPTPPATPGQLAAFRAGLARNDVAVDYLAVMADDVVLEYVTKATTRKGLVSEVGWVAGLFADAVDTDWAIDALDATIYEPDGLPLGVYRVDAAWARRYADGELSTEEYSARVTGTLDLLE